MVDGSYVPRIVGVMPVLTGGRETNPIGVRRRLAGVLCRLPQRAGMCHRIAGIVHGVWHKRSGDRQPAGRAGIALVALLARGARDAALSLWPYRPSLSTLAFWSFGVSKL